MIKDLTHEADIIILNMHVLMETTHGKHKLTEHKIPSLWSNRTLST